MEEAYLRHYPECFATAKSYLKRESPDTPPRLKHLFRVTAPLDSELGSYQQYLHYMTRSMWTPARRTSHFKIMGINMKLVPPFLLLQPPLVGTLLQGLASIQKQEH
jgi:hypothetical protein